MRKTYVLDTNVLLHNANALFAFEDNDLVIPLAVIEEIDNQKKRQDEIGRNARVVSRELDALRETNEKLRPWMQPLYDTLELLFRNCSEPVEVLRDFMRKGMLELEALTYIRGRSIPRQFILCDEAQNLSPHMIKTLITRVGEEAKIVLSGEPEQIDHPYLDASSNGLTCLVERIRNEDISGHVVLVKGERSKVTELGGELL